MELLPLLMIQMTDVALHFLRFIVLSVCFYVSFSCVKSYFSHLIVCLYDFSFVEMDSKDNQELAEDEVI